MTARRGSPLIVLAALGGVLAAGLAWASHWQIQLNDYSTEGAPAYAALRAGHLLGFFRALPVYGGSLELRAPFAMLPVLWGGNGLAVYRFAALPCLLAGSALGVWLAHTMRLRGASVFAALLALLLCAANPITYRALVNGHPEELLGAVLCVACVLVAARGRPAAAGLLLGLAVANKQWGVLAAGPVLIALPSGRVRCMLWAALPLVLLEAPLLLVSGSVLSTGELRTTAANTGEIFRPQQVWWLLGTPGRWIPAMGAQILHDYRTSPGWLNASIHPAIAWLAVPLTLLCVRCRGRREPLDAALLLLALLLLARFMLDPWDVVYYPLPFILALTSWEALVRLRPPLLGLAATGLTWLLFRTLPAHLSGTQQSLAFIAATVPAAIALAVALYGPRPGAAPAAELSFADASPRRAAAW